MNDDFDAGILKDTMAYKWQGKGLRILYSSPNLPPYNIAASKNVDKKLLQQLRQAFLKLDRKNPEHLAVIKALDKKYDGFAATSDAEYDIVRQLIKPFAKWTSGNQKVIASYFAVSLRGVSDGAISCDPLMTMLVSSLSW